MSRYKYDDAYEEYEPLELRDEFKVVEKYLLLDNEHANHEVFDAFDEIYHWFCVKQNEVNKLCSENERLRCGLSEDPFMSLLQEASRRIFKQRSTHNATATYNVLTRNGIKNIDQMMELSIIEATKFRNAGSNVLSVIAGAQELQRKKQQATMMNEVM